MTLAKMKEFHQKWGFNVVLHSYDQDEDVFNGQYAAINEPCMKLFHEI